MKWVRVVFVLAALGILGALPMWSGGGGTVETAMAAEQAQTAKIGSSLIGKLSLIHI